MGNETQINSAPSTSSSSSTSSNISRESKKFRKPVSIFDLPCTPKCAPPQDDKSFFDRMDSIEKALEEEDAGKIPKTLEAGPEIVVESLNKKRRHLQITETPPVTAPELPPIIVPQPHSASSPSLSSSSSAQLLDSFSSASPDTLPVSEKAPESNEVTAPHPPAKRVRFQEEIEYHYIDPRPSPPTVESSGQASTRRRTSGHAGHVSGNASKPMSSRIFTPEMLRPMDDEKRFQGWLSGSTPPPPLPPSISQILMMEEKTQETGSLADSQISNDPDSSQDERQDERQTHSPSLNYERDSRDWEESQPAPELDISAADQGSQIEVGESDGASSGNNKDIIGTTPISDTASFAGANARPNTKHNPKRLHTTAHTTFVEPLANVNSSTGPIDIPEMSSTSGSKGLGRPKKGKDTTTSIAAIIGSRRKQNIVQKPPVTGESQILMSGTETGKSTGTAQSPRGTIPIINLDEEDYAIGSNLEATKIVHFDQAVVPVGSSESSPTTRQMPMNNKERVETRKSEPPKSTSGPLSKLGLYVIPTNMDSRVFDITRKRVIDLGGSWLGPRVKTLATDPRAKPDVPDIDPEKTTHIVTALTSIEDVKRFLGVDEINLKIPVVNREWLSDTIMYKTPMEPQSYALRMVQPTTPLTQFGDITPPPTQGHTNREVPQEMPESQWFPKFKSTMTGNQIAFNDIVQGIQEGSLDDPDVLDTDDDGIIDGDIEGPGKNIEIHAPEEGLNLDEAANPNRLSDDNQPELTPKMKRELAHENRCFRCKGVGHWANRCPQPKPKPKDDEVLLQIINSGKAEEKRRKILYQCQSPHIAGKKEEPKYNKAILEQLKVLMDHYENIKTKDSKEHFKVINYRKAITAIRSLDYEITSEEMALKVPRVGKKIAQKIGECIALGKIKKLEHINWDKERSEVETLFRSVYGVGSEKATEWYNRGLRTLDDLRKQKDLTKNQISGLRYYEDLQKRIPRTEVEEIAAVVDKAAKALHPEIQSQVTGSYRRGKPDCGDIDIVVARPNIDEGDELFDIMEHILNELTNQGFLVDHLSWPSWSEEMRNQPKHFKYMGICKLPGDDKIHRHIDILVVPWIHHGAALLYFTGNDICNRSMRLYASKRGMRLSDKGLFADVIRGPKRQRVNQGRWVAGRTEREIFEYLGIDYLEPYEREC